MAFHHVGKPYKTCRNGGFGMPLFAFLGPFGPPPQFVSGQSLIFYKNLYKISYKNLQQPENPLKFFTKLPNLGGFQGLRILAKMKDSEGVCENMRKTLIKQSTFPPWATWGKVPEIHVLKNLL